MHKRSKVEQEKNLLSLPAAILINLNIMLGAGIFLNTDEFASRVGALGCFVYPFLGLLMLPLIITIAKLVQIYPDLGFYGYGARALSPSVGFMSAWSYFTGKLASAMLMIHIALSLVQQIVVPLRQVPIIGLDIFMIVLFTALNMLDVKTGSAIQKWFMALKIVPIFFSITTGLFLFSRSNVAPIHMLWDGIPSALPLALYVATGFEAACSLSAKIRNAQRNAPRAIFISYGIMLAIAFIYQFAMYGALGGSLARLTGKQGFLGIFPLLLDRLMPGCALYNTMIEAILYLAIASSALGSAYGILYSNVWNLHTLAVAGHVVGKRFFTRLSAYGLPYWCVIAESVICIVYLLVTRGTKVPLQQTSALACSIAYSMSVVSFLALMIYKQVSLLPVWIPLLALCNCVILLGSCVNNFFISGLTPLCLFLCLLGLGLFMFIYTARDQKTQYPSRK